MIYALARPLLFALDPETAHRASIAALAAGIHPRAPVSDPRLKRTVMGLEFPNPVGLAAGYDKGGEVPDAALALGFGFVEIGSVTPRPQPGNPPPRVFRLPADRAVINRLGFNSEGHEVVYARLARRERHGIVGVNLGTNKDSTDRVADYVAGVRRFADVASYLAINISSPNTPGLRDLQERDALARLLDGIANARGAIARRVPVVVKIAPDLDDDALGAIAETVIVAGIDGMIVSNTTLSRAGVGDAKIAEETGGLSGRPLFAPSNKMLTRLRRMVGGRLALIGTGGIDSVTAARQKLAAGADLVQLYTGMIYEGPGLPGRIVGGLARAIP
ncbi:MAG TPA: quinone-dependent dihydroorotate dehydrogenase [Bauldia sp.]|nr:quinone-dependent dihydroorotate dehydrogenase [Bauldia sp.]